MAQVKNKLVHNVDDQNDSKGDQSKTGCQRWWLIQQYRKLLNMTVWLSQVKMNLLLLLSALASTFHKKNIFQKAMRHQCYTQQLHPRSIFSFWMRHHFNHLRTRKKRRSAECTRKTLPFQNPARQARSFWWNCMGKLFTKSVTKPKFQLARLPPTKDAAIHSKIPPGLEVTSVWEVVADDSPH